MPSSDNKLHINWSVVAINITNFKLNWSIDENFHPDPLPIKGFNLYFAETPYPREQYLQITVKL